jgi:hypothetical protein
MAASWVVKKAVLWAAQTVARKVASKESGMADLWAAGMAVCWVEPTAAGMVSERAAQ